MRTSKRPRSSKSHKFDFPSVRPASKSSEIRDESIKEIILSIPYGKVATYGQIAAAAGFPHYHRAVAKLLADMLPGQYPWHRVVGAGGEIKVNAEDAEEQRLLLGKEEVTFNGKRANRVNLAEHQHNFEPLP